MLSCFPFSYSPLKDDDYAQLFIGQQQYQLEEKSNDNSLSVDCVGGDNICQTNRQINSTTTTTTATTTITSSSSPSLLTTNNTRAINSSSSSPSSTSSLINNSNDDNNELVVLDELEPLGSHEISSSPYCHRDQLNKIPLSLPRTFRKPDNIISNIDSCETIQSSNTIPSTKSSRLKFSFHRSKGTEHLQEALRLKSTESKVSHAHRYIKLPTSSVSRFTSKSNDKSSSDLVSDNNKNRNLITSQISNQIPKPPLTKSLGLKQAPSCLTNLTPKPPPRPLTSHPGKMPRQKVQWASSSSQSNPSGYNSNDANTDNNVSSYTTGDTSLVGATPSASTSETSPATNNNRNCNSAANTSTSSTTSTSDWTKGASFINKPPRGWLHPDQKIAESGMSYGVRYIGCLGINTSMKSLDFDTRSQIAKECINRVCEAGGLKTPDKKRRTEKRISRMLADNPNMESAGSNVTLTITSSYLNLAVMETGEVIAKHEMPNISFASGGDADTLDFVAYVAKDHRYGRACFVLECGGGLAQDVITTIGQAFELRFKEFLKRTPRNTSCNNERIDNNVVHNGSSNNSKARNTSGNLSDEREYYNDLPGKIPPDVPANAAENGISSTTTSTSTKEISSLQRVLPQAAPRNCLKKSNSEQSSPNLIDLNTDIQGPSLIMAESKDNNNDPGCSQQNVNVKSEVQYVNCANGGDGVAEQNSNEFALNLNPTFSDPFDMQPFNSAIAQVENCSPTPSNANSSISQLLTEDWYHGPISRKDSETLVAKDGDFLVRESQGSPGQYVLTGMQGGIRKHLLLVDPEGVVRTKDKTFESVSHLINYHRNNGLPIISAESALVLRNPVLVKR